nr:hypothetical protein [Burkholderia sp. ABCPW 11]
MSNRSYFMNVLPLRQKASIRPANVDPLVAFERQRAVDAPCDTPFGDHCVDVQPGIENAPTLRCGDTALFVPGSASLAHAQSSLRRHPPEKTTVATCGTTVVARDATVTLWA